MYEIQDASDLSASERQEIMDVLLTLHANDCIEIVTGNVIEMRDGGIFIDEKGPLSVQQAFTTIIPSV